MLQTFFLKRQALPWSDPCALNILVRCITSHRVVTGASPSPKTIGTALCFWASWALAGLADKPGWLDASSVYAQLAPGKSAIRAAARYADFVAEGKGVRLWADHLRQQIYLGDDAFIARIRKQAGLNNANLVSKARGRKANVSKIHANIPIHDSDVKRYAAMKFTSKDQRNQHIANGFYQGGHSQTALALAFGVSSSTVSRVVMGYENGV